MRQLTSKSSGRKKRAADFGVIFFNLKLLRYDLKSGNISETLRVKRSCRFSQRKPERVVGQIR